jgi:hypothetical protein
MKEPELDEFDFNNEASALFGIYPRRTQFKRFRPPVSLLQGAVD